MSRTTGPGRELDAVCEAIDALDRDLAAGRLSPDEHARRRAEREREVGRLFLAHRRARRQRPEDDARRRPPGAEAPPEPRAGWLRTPVGIAVAAAIFLAVGIGAGILGERWLRAAPAGARAAGPTGARATTPGDPPASVMSAPALRALGEIAARDDAPIASLLEFAHLALDQGRLAEARQVYERVLAREPRNAEAITHIGSVLFQEKRVDEALVKVEEALRIDPGYIHAHWDRTQYLFHGKRDYAAAIRAATAFLELVPDGPDADHVRDLMAEARTQEARRTPLAPRPR